MSFKELDKKIILDHKDIVWLSKKYPDLKVTKNNTIEGKLKFNHFFQNRKMAIEGKYTLIIDLKIIKKFQLPTVKETQGDFEKIAQELNMELIDLHIQSDKSICLAIPQKHKDCFPENKFSLKIFLKKFVEPFLYWISFYKKYKKPPWKGYSHFAKGQIEFLFEELSKKNDINQIKKNILEKENVNFEILLKNLTKIKGHSECLCGSKKKVRNCHSILKESPYILK